MSIDLRAIAAEAEKGLRKFRALAEAVAGSPVTRAMERLAPGLSALAQDAEAVARVAGVLGDVTPALPALVTAIDGLRSLGFKPMDPADPVYLERERELGG